MGLQGLRPSCACLGVAGGDGGAGCGVRGGSGQGGDGVGVWGEGQGTPCGQRVGRPFVGPRPRRAWNWLR